MNNRIYSSICVGACAIGFLIYALTTERILIRPWGPPSFAMYPSTNYTTKKEILINFVAHETWQTEKKTALWSTTDTIYNSKMVIQTWLTVLYEEKIISKKVALQSILSPYNGHTLYCSFDRNFLDKDISIHAQCLIIESMLATLRINNCTYQEVHFLVDHKPLPSVHLDFSKPWPADGFFNK